MKLIPVALSLMVALAALMGSTRALPGPYALADPMPWADPEALADLSMVGTAHIGIITIISHIGIIIITGAGKLPPVRWDDRWTSNRIPSTDAAAKLGIFNWNPPAPQDLPDFFYSVQNQLILNLELSCSE
ncbi:uncharacterized protein LOC135204575 [Macrobrachium nipponense]|uniref:uncharacterized protein LOC135204575 n=1 Tax=Macrobrachium nipponense TaxID=159736 RepID=UPI0030C7E94C